MMMDDLAVRWVFCFGFVHEAREKGCDGCAVLLEGRIGGKVGVILIVQLSFTSCSRQQGAAPSVRVRLGWQRHRELLRLLSYDLGVLPTG